MTIGGPRGRQRVQEEDGYLLTLIECPGSMSIHHIAYEAHEVADDGQLPVLLARAKPEGHQHGYHSPIACHGVNKATEGRGEEAEDGDDEEEEEYWE